MEKTRLSGPAPGILQEVSLMMDGLLVSGWPRGPPASLVSHVPSLRNKRKDIGLSEGITALRGEKGKTVRWFLKTLNLELPRDSAAPRLGRGPGETKMHSNGSSPVSSHSSPKWNQPADDDKQKATYPYRGVLLGPQKEWKSDPCRNTERSQTQECPVARDSV